eukprot:8237777-Alexandrium_andersonii.AAC.1
MSYATLAKRVRLHNPRLGISRGRKRTDICPFCRCWDAVVSKDRRKGANLRKSWFPRCQNPES